MSTYLPDDVITVPTIMQTASCALLLLALTPTLALAEHILYELMIVVSEMVG